MRFFSKSLLAGLAGLTIAAGTLTAPAQAVGETVDIQATSTSLSGSSISGFDPSKTLYITIANSAGTLSWLDQASGAQSLGQTTNVSSLRLTGTQSQLNSALQNEISVSGPCSGNMTIAATVSESEVVANPLNGHLYTISSGAYTFEDSVTYAGTVPLVPNGTDTYGYLVTITSDEENDFLYNSFGNSFWFGATDSAVEGEWRWVSGPESGELFWTGEADGQAPSGVYAHWGGGEPNNSGNEDYPEFRSDKLWNDIGNDYRRALIEYGGMPGDNLSQVSFFAGSDTVNITSAINGSGTEQQPYLVSNAAEFAAVEKCDGNGVYFQQDADITVSNFAGIGSESFPFIGHYDGDDYSITETGVTFQNTNRRGLFNVIGSWDLNRSDTTIKNLTITSTATLDNTWGVGLLVGDSRNASVSNISVGGSMTIYYGYTTGGVVGRSEGSEFKDIFSEVDLIIQSDLEKVGGIFGETYGPELSNSQYAGTITFTGSDYYAYSIGGIAGYIESGSAIGVESTGSISAPETIYGNSWGVVFGRAWGTYVNHAYGHGAVTAPTVNSIGGLAGAFNYAVLEGSKSSGAVSGYNNIGGLVGYGEGASIVDTYSQATVTAISTGGALVGEIDCSNISQSYAIGKVVAGSGSKGLVGQGCGTVQSSYWVPSLVEVTENGSIDQEQAITLEDAQDIETYNSWSIADYVDASSKWVICAGSNNGLPSLQFFGSDCLLKINQTDAPYIQGSGAPGQLIQSNTGTWEDGVTFTYVWKADGEVIAGATGATFTPSEAYLDKEITVWVTGSKAGYAPFTRDSNALYISIPSFTNKTEPLIVGSGKAGVALTVNKGSWDAGVTFTYVWKADGQAIAGATGSSFTPGENLDGKQITVDITGTKTGYRTETLNSGNSVTVSIETVVTPPVKRTVSSVFGGFAANDWAIPATLTAKIKALAKSHSSATSVLCTGIVKYNSDTASQKGVGFNRAKAVCAQVAKLKPGIKVTYTWKFAAKGAAVQRGVAIRFNR